MIDELVTGLVEREQAVLRELVRLAELNTAQALAEPAFHAASMSIRAQLRAHAAKVEELELLASEQDRAADVEQAMRHVSRHRNEGATLQASLRDLGGKVRAGRAQQEAVERSALLLGTPSPADGGAGGGAVSSKLSDRAATQKAHDVTSSLRRTRQLMTSELQRGDTTLQSLDGQTKTIKDTLQEQKGVTNNASSGRAALGRLQRRGCTDKALIALGFLFFLLVVLHIVKKRLVADGEGGMEAAAEANAANQADPTADAEAMLQVPGEASEKSGSALGSLLDGAEALASASLTAAIASASGAAFVTASVAASGAGDALGDDGDGPLAGALVDDETIAPGLKSEL